MKRSCKATTRAGKPCKSPPQKEGDYCLAHASAEVRDSVGFIARNGKGGRPRRPREIELIQEVAEQFRAALREVYATGLTAERAVVVGNGPSAHVEMVPDLPHRLAVAKEINDRLHGRPRQQTEITGGDGGPVEVKLPTEAEWHAEVAQALVAVGAVAAPEQSGGDDSPDPA